MRSFSRENRQQLTEELEADHFAKRHASVTPGRMVERELITLDNPGVCLGCGEEAMGCEPDARRRREACGESKVYGAQEALLRISLKLLVCLV